MASAAHNIFSLWAELFSQGREVLALTGGWVSIDGEPMESGEFSTIIADRENLVA